MKWRKIGAHPLLIVALSAVLFGLAPVQAALIIYEPFDDSNASLAGNSSGTGLSGTWNGSSAVVAPTPLTFGTLQTPSGNQVSASNQNGYIPTGSSLSAAGLLDNDATLWFSVLVRAGSDIATNGDLGFGFGTDNLNSGNNIPIANSGQALGFTFKGNQVRASYWAPTLTRSATNSGNGTPPETLYLIAGKITWGASSETIEIYNVGPDLSLGSPVSTYTTPTNLDQAQFDTISFGSKSAGALPHLFDEIRFGGSFADVAPAAVPEPSTWALLSLGCLMGFVGRTSWHRRLVKRHDLEAASYVRG